MPDHGDETQQQNPSDRPLLLWFLTEFNLQNNQTIMKIIELKVIEWGQSY